MSTSEDSSQKAELDKVAKTSLLSSRCPHQFPSVAVLVFLHQFYLHRFFVLTRCLCLSASPSSYACIELKCRTVYSPLPLPLSFTTRLVYCFITFLWIPLLSLPPFFLSDDGSSIIFCSLELRYSQRQLCFGFQACTLYWTSAGFQGILYRKLYMTREKQAIIFRLKKTIQMRS